jgi:hypothetical protein
MEFVGAVLRGRTRRLMTEWIPVGNDFIAADLIRWRESVFKTRRSKQGRTIRLGEQLVIAEVLRGAAVRDAARPLGAT